MVAPNLLLQLSRFTLMAFSCGWTLLLSPIIPQAVADDTPTAAGLLRGAKLAREAISSMQCMLELEITHPGTTSKREFKVELLGRKWRFEQLGDPPTIAITDGEVRYHYTRSKHQDLAIRAERDAAFQTTAVIFDPRILGLSDICPASLTPDQAFWEGEDVTSRVVGRERLGDVDVWRVASTRGEATKELWIEVPSFRIHRSSVESPQVKTDVRSTFERHTKGVLPSEVVATRTDDSMSTRRYKILSIDYGPVSEDRFTFRSLDLPLGTAAVDYSLSRAVGYWDGERFAPTRGEAEVTPLAVPKSSYRSFLIPINIALIIAVCVWIVMKRRGK